MKKAIEFTRYASWINDYCSNSSHPLIKDSGKMMNICLELERQIPNEYHWKYSNVESFKAQMVGIKGSKAINELYWKDQLRNLEAYSIMSYWRAIELLKPAVRCLNVHDVVSAAVLSRSLLELSTVYITNANKIDATFETLKFPPNTLVMSDEIEALIVKMIWGTRLGNPEPYLNQTNIFTLIQKLSKKPNAGELLPAYEYLCELAHPNVIGNTRFWSHVEYLYDDGSERRLIAKKAKGELVDEIMDKILWSIGWASVCVRNSFAMMSDSISGVLGRLQESA